MAKTPPKVDRVVQRLLSDSASSGVVSLDAIGAALGTEAFSVDEIELLVQSLERAGRSILTASYGGVDALRRVLDAARAIAARDGRRASVAAIAKEAGLSEDAVRAALLLAQVMGR